MNAYLIRRPIKKQSRWYERLHGEHLLKLRRQRLDQRCEFWVHGVKPLAQVNDPRRERFKQALFRVKKRELIEVKLVKILSKRLRGSHGKTVRSLTHAPSGEICRA
jgi:hypothetical protein